MTRRKVLHIGLAVLIYLAVIGVLLVFRFGAYRGTLGGVTVLDLMAAMPPVLAVVSLIRSDKEMFQPGPLAVRIGDIVSWLCGVTLAFLAVIELNKTLYSLEAWLLAAAVVLCGIICLIPPLRVYTDKPEHVYIWFSIFYGVSLVVIIAFLAVMRPVTVRGAEQLVERAGYQDASYRTTWQGPDARLFTSAGTQEPDSPDENSWGYYWLSAKKDGEEYAVAVSVTEGRICAAEKQGGDGLKYW